INKSTFTNNDFQDSLIIEINNRWQKIFNPVYLITWFLHPYHHGEGLNPTWLLYIQEAAYGLFCIFYPDYNQDKFIDEWLNYSNHEAQKLNEIESNILDNDDYIDSSDDYIDSSDDYIDGNDDVDEFIVNLNQISEKLIDDIHVLDLDSEETIPALMDIFDSKIVERSLNVYI
ncbi:3337_t:CDS:2, partial [Racocetra fulgida]